MPAKPTVTPQGDTPGQRLRAARKSLGLTQLEAAEVVGCSRSYYTTIEVGLKTPNLDWFFAAARKLGVRPSDLSPKLTDRLKD